MTQAKLVERVRLLQAKVEADKERYQNGLVSLKRKKGPGASADPASKFQRKTEESEDVNRPDDVKEEPDDEEGPKVKTEEPGEKPDMDMVDNEWKDVSMWKQELIRTVFG